MAQSLRIKSRDLSKVNWNELEPTAPAGAPLPYEGLLQVRNSREPQKKTNESLRKCSIERNPRLRSVATPKPVRSRDAVFFRVTLSHASMAGSGTLLDLSLWTRQAFEYTRTVRERTAGLMSLSTAKNKRMLAAWLKTCVHTAVLFLICACIETWNSSVSDMKGNATYEVWNFHTPLKHI